MRSLEKSFATIDNGQESLSPKVQETVVERISKNDLTALFEAAKAQRAAQEAEVKAQRAPEIEEARGDIEAAFAGEDHGESTTPSLQEGLSKNDLNALAESFRKPPRHEQGPEESLETVGARQAVEAAFTGHDSVEATVSTATGAEVSSSETREQRPAGTEEAAKPIDMEQATEKVENLESELSVALDAVKRDERQVTSRLADAQRDVDTLVRQMQEIEQAGYAKLPNLELVGRFRHKVEQVAAVLQAASRTGNRIHESAASIVGDVYHRSLVAKSPEAAAALATVSRQLEGEIQQGVADSPNIRSLYADLNTIASDPNKPISVIISDLRNLSTRLRTAADLPPVYSKKLTSALRSLS